jgi:hypothetical protein
MTSISAVRRAAFAAALCLTILSAAPAHAFRLIQNFGTGRFTAGALVECNDPGGFIHWDQTAITWYLNPALQGAGTSAELTAALTSWNNVTPATYNMTNGGTTGVGFVTDGINAVVWGPGGTGSPVGSSLAITALVLQAGQVLVESDVYFNNDYAWYHDGVNETYDVQSTLVHEIGHTLGLHHTEINVEPYPTMRVPYFGFGRRTLEQDDKDGLNCIFNRYPPPGLTVTYPNGGEALVVLCDATITWTPPPGVSTVDIEYSYNAGTNWIPIATGTPNDGSHVWSVPGFTTAQALVRVTAGALTDVSDAYFTISVGSPAVTYPNGGEILTAGGTANITWTAPPCLATVSLAYSTTGSPPWWSIVSQTPNDGSYSWTIPAAPTTQAKVQVYAGAAIDASNGPFMIQGVGVTYPNYAEYLPSGTVVTITWASVNAGATANIEYSTNGGSTWTSIVSGTPNDGAHDWTVPAIATTQGRVRVSSGVYSDISDFNFNIVVPSTAWVPDGVMLKFKTADNIQYPETVTDGAGGAFVCWKRTYGANLGVYVNRVTGAGAMPSPWPFGGKKIASADGSVWQPHHTVADGSGGLYAGFNTSGNSVVQHATSNGDVQTGWPVDGVVLGPGSRTRLSPDGSGGVYSAWIGSGGVRIQRLTSSGALATGWPAGGVLVASGTFYSVDVVGDGTAGAYVTGDGFVHRMTSSGVKDPAWPASGLAIPSCYRVRIVGDGAGGAVVSYANGPFNQVYTLKATRVRSDATFFPGWNSAGATLSTEAEQFHYYDYHQMAADGTGGALLAFSTTGSQAIKAHRVNGTGALASGWPSGGAVLSSYYYSLKASPTLTNDGNGGCVATWQELRNFTGCEGQPNLEGCDWDIFSGHVAHSGIVDPTFATDGTVISALLTVQALPFLTSASAGKGIVAWQDNRPDNSFCIRCEAAVFAQQVPFDAVPPAAVSLSAAPGCTDVTLSWTAPGDDGSTGTASLYDLRASTSPIDDGSFLSAAQIASFAPTGPAGTPQSFVHSVGVCSPPYYYALKTRDDSGNWSAISNVPNAQATCCGGGGGCPVADVLTASGWVTDNTVLSRSRDGSMSTQYQRLRTPAAIVEGRYQVRLHENGKDVSRIDRLALMAVDHAPEDKALVLDGDPLVGRVVPPVRVVTADGNDVTDLLSVDDGREFHGQPGDVLYVEWPLNRFKGAVVMEPRRKEMLRTKPTPRDDGAVPVTRSMDARILDETGYRVEAETGPGEWRSVARGYPRQEPEQVVFGGPVVKRYRITFVGTHDFDFLGAFVPSAGVMHAPIAEALEAAHSSEGAVTSALAEVDGAIATLGPGDIIQLSFALPAVPEGLSRDLFLVSHGVYSTPPEQEQTGTWAPPAAFALQNHPNPFTRATTIRFDLPVATSVRLEVFDLHGRRLTVLADGSYPAGTHSLHWDGLDAAKNRVKPGIYLYRLRAAGTEVRRRMIVLP